MFSRPRHPLLCLCSTSVLLALSHPARAALISLTPTQDTFGRAALPNATYGSAGGLHVAGPSAVNANGDPQGAADTWMRFNTASAKSSFDTAYGPGNWRLVAASLQLTESAAPTSPIFNRGVGQFHIRWIADDNWSEGTGAAGAPGTATGNQIGYTYGLSILNPILDQGMGGFKNTGANGPRTYNLALSSGIRSDLAAADPLTLYLTAIQPQIGFTFNAGTQMSGKPTLTLEANFIPEPATATLLSLAAVAVLMRRRRGSAE